MAGNYNLIPAAELPTTEAEEVDVLCVENGELKRKPAANLSGGGGGYVIHVPADECSIDENTGEITVRLTESRDNFSPVLEAGGSVWVDFSATSLVEAMGAQVLCVPVGMWAYLEGVLLLAVNLLGANGLIYCTNGTWTPAAVASTGEAEV